MSTRIGAIHVDMGLNTAQFAKGITSVKKDAKGLASSLKSSLAGISKNFGIGLLGGAGGITGIAATLRTVASGVADIRNEAARAGVSTKVFQEWSAVATKARIPIDAMVDGFKELNIRADEFATTGKGSAADAFARLGLTPQEVKERIKDPAEFMLLLIQRTKELKDTAAATRIFDELFGGTGAEKLVTLLGQSTDEIRTTIREANDLGQVLSEDVIKSAADLDAAFNKIANTVSTNLKGAIVEAAGALQDFINRFSAFQNWRDSSLQDEFASLGMRRLEIEGELGRLRGLQPTEGAGDGGWLFGIGESTAAEKMYELQQELDQVAVREKQINDILSERAKLREKANTPLTPSFTPIIDDKPKKTKTEAERAAERAAKELDKSIANQASVAVDAVTELLGMHEKKNTGTINAFLKRGGVDLNAATTAWCAAFVNSALAQVGVTGSGSQVATNFANWGTGVNASDAQRGDVLVQMRGNKVGETGGHVGLSTGQMRFRDGILELQMISGNASNQVQEDWVKASDTIVRRATEAMQLPPEALRNLSEEAQAATKASEDALKRQQQTAEQMGSILQTAISGLTTALADGKIEANEMLSIVLQIAQQLLSMQALKGGGGGGIFGSILSGLLGGFDQGGFTGVGAKKTPAGIVHKGEYVIPADKVAKMGLGNIERLMAGYANGGLVGANSFRLPKLDEFTKEAAHVQGRTFIINAPINAPGADKAEIARLRREVQMLGKSMPSMIDSRTKERETRRTRASYYGTAR